MNNFKEIKELELLEALAKEPDARQVDLAARLGVAVGTVNWHLKRFVAKGYVKVSRIGRWHWSYILTPRGMAEKARLTMSYVRSSMSLYRQVRERSKSLLQQVKQARYKEVVLEGEGDLVDVCRLTCMEQGVHPLPVHQKADVPVLRVQESEIVLQWPDDVAFGGIGHLQSDTLREIRERIVRASSPEKIIIFGSYAHGTPDEDSDVDLLVIKRGIQSKVEEYSNIRKSLKGIKLPFDVIIVTPEEFEFYSAQWQNSLVAEARERGIVLYES